MAAVHCFPGWSLVWQVTNSNPNPNRTKLLYFIAGLIRPVTYQTVPVFLTVCSRLLVVNVCDCDVGLALISYQFSWIMQAYIFMINHMIID